jgi:hypothetical protein
VAGTKVVDELSQAAQEYAEKYKVESEIKKLKGEKDKRSIQSKGRRSAPRALMLPGKFS